VQPGRARAGRLVSHATASEPWTVGDPCGRTGHASDRFDANTRVGHPPRMRMAWIARSLAFVAVLGSGCADDSVSATGTETDGSTGTAGDGSPTTLTTTTAMTTAGPGDDTAADDTAGEGSTAGDGESTSAPPDTSTGTETGNTGEDDSAPTTGEPFVCEPFDLGDILGEVATGTTDGEQNDLLVPCMKFDSVDLEFSWTAPYAGTFQVDTYGSTYDTALMVLATDCDGEQLACNDDIGTPQSALLVTLEAGETVLVVLDGFGGAKGDFTLNISEAAPGDCCTPGPFAGCDDTTCQDAVCASDPSCCNEAWDSHCALELAPQLCEECIPPGSCCFPHEDPGCDENSCEQSVCEVDPTCCTDTYTQACADIATSVCFECQPNTGDCCTTHGTPGCEDIACEIEVCQLEPFCCDVGWDQFCADTAVDNCIACIDPGPCCFANFGVGCEDMAVQDCVCATMPECCTGPWTQACADQVETGACGTCLAADYSCANTDLGSATGEVATGTNVGAGNDYALQCVPPGGEEVIFQWTAPYSGEWVFDTTGTDYDVGLAILFPDCAATPPYECDADFNTFAQQIELDVPEAVTVLIVIDGFGPTTGNFVLNINPPGGDGFCCLANGSPGCSAPSCQQEVCAIDATCCAGTWDSDCADLAVANCAACQPEALGDCCQGNPGQPGCEDLACAANVCSIDAWCCNGSWEPYCADYAANACGGLCN
jgi:hypothetical protein